MSFAPAIRLTHGAAVIRLCIGQDSYGRIQELADSFALDGDAEITSLELYAAFVEHCDRYSHSDALVVFKSFCQEYNVPAVDMHLVVQQHGLDEEGARRILRAYYLLWDNSAAHSCYFHTDGPALPALFTPGNARLTAMFGGQPGTSSYLNEARWLLDTYGPLVRGYVENISVFLVQQAQDPRFSPLLQEGLDVGKWLSGSMPMPDAEYIISAPVSVPLTGFIQLMQIMVLYKTLGISPGKLSQCFKGMLVVVGSFMHCCCWGGHY
ncbi:fatty acid synthase alpha subunit Lsd1 [Coemansia sp. RSA 552]|nr:fatty acid synthase alpha subunit Lsd1 [Coemansia sp. RSA 552]